MKPDESSLEKLTQSLSDLIKPDDIEEIQLEQTTTEEPIAPTSTGTPGR